jgi:hypothetical protein
MKTSELTGAFLDWAVAKCEGLAVSDRATKWRSENCPHLYSTDWALSGPIIEDEGISVAYDVEMSQSEGCEYWATIYAIDSGEGRIYGSTPMIAAMRCYVASKLGDTVEIPEGLQNA